MKYIIRCAHGESDLQSILALRREAERWLADQGIKQWTPDYEDTVYALWKDAVLRGASWVIVHDATNETAGTVTLDKPDRDFWLPDDAPETGLYLGKMVVRRSHAGHGLGDTILNWASQRAKDLGFRWLRLECRRDNLQLQKYYLDRGFAHVRTQKPTHRRTESGALFQRPAGYEHQPPLPPDVELARLCEG